MKKSVRLVLTAAVLMSMGTAPVFATVSGGNPHPQTVTSSTSTIVLAEILSVLGF